MFWEIMKPFGDDAQQEELGHWVGLVSYVVWPYFKV